MEIARGFSAKSAERAENSPSYTIFCKAHQILESKFRKKPVYGGNTCENVGEILIFYKLFAAFCMFKLILR